MDRKEAVALLTKLKSIWPNNQLHDKNITAEYVSFFIPLKYSKAFKAIEQIKLTMKFIPTIAELYTAYSNIRNDDALAVLEECNKCNNLGFHIYKKDFEGRPYTFVAKCSCRNGNKYSNFTNINEVVPEEFIERQPRTEEVEKLSEIKKQLISVYSD